MKSKKRICIIGAGPAGVSCAIYLKRFGIKFKIFSENIGGQLQDSAEIENFLSHRSVYGAEMIKMLEKQMQHLNIQVEKTKIENITKKQNFTLEFSDRQKQCFDYVILATGCRYKKLKIPGEQQYKYHGVSNCVLCDGFLYKNQDVAVIGGGNSAIEASLILAKFCRTVYVINKNAKFKGDKLNLEKMLEKSNIKVFLNSLTSSFQGDKFLQKITFLQKNKTATRAISGAFVKIGNLPNSEFVAQLNQQKRIFNDFNFIVCKNNITDIADLFACGDICANNPKQLIIAAADGAKCAIMLEKTIAKN